MSGRSMKSRLDHQRHFEDFGPSMIWARILVHIFVTDPCRTMKTVPTLRMVQYGYINDVRC